MTIKVTCETIHQLYNSLESRLSLTPAVLLAAAAWELLSIVCSSIPLSAGPHMETSSGWSRATTTCWLPAICTVQGAPGRSPSLTQIPDLLSEPRAPSLPVSLSSHSSLRATPPQNSQVYHPEVSWGASVVSNWKRPAYGGDQ